MTQQTPHDRALEAASQAWNDNARNGDQAQFVNACKAYTVALLDSTEMLKKMAKAIYCAPLSDYAIEEAQAVIAAIKKEAGLL